MVELKTFAKKYSEEILQLLEKGPMSFNNLQSKIRITEGSQKISSRTLADRLTELENEGLIIREVSKTRPPKTKYSLTDRGIKVVELALDIRGL